MAALQPSVSAPHVAGASSLASCSEYFSQNIRDILNHGDATPSCRFARFQSNLTLSQAEDPQWLKVHFSTASRTAVMVRTHFDGARMVEPVLLRSWRHSESQLHALGALNPSIFGGDADEPAPWTVSELSSFDLWLGIDSSHMRFPPDFPPEGSGCTRRYNCYHSRAQRTRMHFGTVEYGGEDAPQGLSFDPRKQHEPSLIVFQRLMRLRFGRAYDYVWVVENDAYFEGNPASFFATYATSPADYVGRMEGFVDEGYAHHFNNHPGLSWTPSRDVAFFKFEHVERYSQALLDAYEEMYRLKLFTWGEKMGSACRAWRWCRLHDMNNHTHPTKYFWDARPLAPFDNTSSSGGGSGDSVGSVGDTASAVTLPQRTLGSSSSYPFDLTNVWYHKVTMDELATAAERLWPLKEAVRLAALASVPGAN